MVIELPDGRSESNEVLEALRLRAVHARELGYAVVDIATILGVREETISRWCSRYDQGGQAGRLHLKSWPGQHFFKIAFVPAGGEAFVLDADLECGLVLQ